MRNLVRYSFFDLLFAFVTVLLIVLRICNVIKWSWYLVLLPVWAAMILGSIFVIVTLIISVVKDEKGDNDNVST